MSRFYTVEYWFHDYPSELYDYERIAVEADSEDEAIEKAKDSHNVPVDAKAFKIIY